MDLIFYLIKWNKNAINVYRSNSKVYLKSLVKYLDLQLIILIVCLHPLTKETFLSRITLKSLHV